jgi:RluA family pseudouridine synthase
MRKETIEMIYQDDGIIVINKPSGVSVTKDRSRMPQLTDFLSEQIGAEATSKLRLIHRLDKDTSGVMILACNRDAQRAYADLFFQRKVHKTYLAIVKGAVMDYSGTINAPIGHSKKNPALMVIDNRKGKESITEWRLLADFGLAALLAVTPLTGRTHQIRVHLASVGLPLAFDPLYGSNLPIMLSEYKKNYRLGLNQEEKPLIDRLTLHAYQLVIPEVTPAIAVSPPVIPASSLVIPAQAGIQSVIPAKAGIQSVIPAQAGIQSVSPAQAGIQGHCFIARLDKKFAATIKMLAKHSPKGDMAFVHADEFEKILTGQSIEPSADSQPNVLPDSST